MRSLPKGREEPLSLREIITAGGVVVGFVVCSVVFAKLAYAAVALLLHGATYAVQVSMY
jgi:hypothetical protein